MGIKVLFSDLSDCADVDAMLATATSTDSASRYHRKQKDVVAFEEVDGKYDEDVENERG